MNDPDPVDVAYERGCQLLELKRYDDAERTLRDVLRMRPNHDWAFHQLAYIAWQQNCDSKAYELARQAIGANPDEASHHVLYSYVIGTLRRNEEALQAADHAIRLNPDGPTGAGGFTARAFALLSLGRRAECETAARHALALEPEFSRAHYILGLSLMVQGRREEARTVIENHLRLCPEDSQAHFNAGWMALELGNSRKAVEHFGEALRGNPCSLEYVHGLKAALRTKYTIYRASLAFILWYERRAVLQVWATIIGSALVAWFAHSILVQPGFRWLGIALLALITGVWACRGIGNLSLLADRFGRLVLNSGEKVEAFLAGLGYWGGLVLATTGMIQDHGARTQAGALLLLTAIPWTGVFKNERKAGRWLFAAMAALASLSGLALAIPEPGLRTSASAIIGFFRSIAGPVTYGCLLTIWLRQWRSLRQDT